MIELIEKEGSAADEAIRLREIAENAQVSSQRIVDLNKRLQELKARQKELQSSGIGLGHQEYDSNAAEIAQINSELKDYQKLLTDTAEKQSRLNRVGFP